MKQLRKLATRWSDKPLQFKINRVKRQRGNSNNCGYFSCEFLIDRYKGKTFKKASKFTIIEDSIRGEKEIKKLKKTLKHFNDI